MWQYIEGKERACRLCLVGPDTEEKGGEGGGKLEGERRRKEQTISREERG
jgi:hypothetical protein